MAMQMRKAVGAAAVVAAVCGMAQADTGLGRHKQLYVVPAPSRVVIDGKLDEWDLSGQIEMFVVSETKAMQSARFAVMRDADALYLGAVVRDPSPMMNRQDPQVNGLRGWDADSCQFRLTVDPSQAYPINDSSFVHKGKTAVPDTRDDIVQLTLWYFSDRAEPCLGMQLGMTYRIPRPEWAPFGIVPAALYEAKYARDPDGRGYTFEYRIPWRTLGAKAPLKGGDVVAGTVQFNWGQPDGLKTAGGSAWAYDVMSGPGFVFQNAAVWGKLIFSDKGGVARDLVEAGVPAEKPLPLEFSYDLPRDGQVTLQLSDASNLVRRILVAQGDRRQGRNVERWDGMDDHGKPLPAGDYRCRGIIHPPITSKFLFSAHNSGQPPYPTDDNKGGWGGDHGVPRACSAIPGGMILAWDGAEYGWGIIRVDLEGRKQWGSRSGSLLLANDGRRLFVYDPHGFQAAPGIQVFDLADGRPLNFGNGQPLLKMPGGEGAGDGETETPARANDAITGLAYGAGRVFVACGPRNLIAVFDAASGEPAGTWTVPAPGDLAVRPDGAVLVVSHGTVLEGRPTTGTPGAGVAWRPFASDHLDAPAGIAVGGDGTVYVANGGALQNVSVFAADGTYRASIGKAGGRPARGVYDPKGLYTPAGLAVDERGRVWVAERADSPKRVSVWSKEGAFEREFFGGSSYFGYAYINPAVPDELYCHNVLWKVDWDTYTPTPLTTVWRKTAPDMIHEFDPSGYGGCFRSMTATNGHEYAIGMARPMSILARRDGPLFKPFLATFSVNRGWSLWSAIGIPLLDDPARTPDGSYLWQDLNDDQCVQSNEVYRFKERDVRLGLKALAPDMSVWADGGQVLRPVRWLENGQPVYDPARVATTFLTGTKHGSGALWLDTDGAVYTLAAGQLSRWRADGTLEWGYPGIPDWHSSLGLPVVRPGVLHGLTGGLGVAGDFTGNMTYFGPCHLFDRHGIYTAMVFRDGRVGGLGYDVGQPEGQGGTLVRVVTKPGAAPRTLVLAGGQDGRVLEVLGLDAIQPLPETRFTLTPEQVRSAAEALAAYKARTGQGGTLAIAADRKAMDAAAGVTKDLDGERRFTVRACREGQALVVRFDVVAPGELINTAVEPKLVFKGGNCLDIQLAADAGADPKRKTPVPGDLRLLVTRQGAGAGKAKPFAVLYQPKVRRPGGEPVVLVSPTGKESFDAIAVTDRVGLDYRKTGDGFRAVVTIPLDLIGLTLSRGAKVRMDLGYVYGNASGSQVAARSYVYNNSFSAHVVNDVPNESRLEPAQWGDVPVE